MRTTQSTQLLSKRLQRLRNSQKPVALATDTLKNMKSLTRGLKSFNSTKSSVKGGLRKSFKGSSKKAPASKANRSRSKKNRAKKKSEVARLMDRALAISRDEPVVIGPSIATVDRFGSADSRHRSISSAGMYSPIVGHNADSLLPGHQLGDAGMFDSSMPNMLSSQRLGHEGSMSLSDHPMARASKPPRAKRNGSKERFKKKSRSRSGQRLINIDSKKAAVRSIGTEGSQSDIRGSRKSLAENRPRQVEEPNVKKIYGKLKEKSAQLNSLLDKLSKIVEV